MVLCSASCNALPPQAADRECCAWLVDARVPFALVFTKLDKRKKKCPRPEENIAAFRVRLNLGTRSLGICAACLGHRSALCLFLVGPGLTCAGRGTRGQEGLLPAPGCQFLANSDLSHSLQLAFCMLMHCIVCRFKPCAAAKCARRPAEVIVVQVGLLLCLANCSSRSHCWLHTGGCPHLVRIRAESLPGGLCAAAHADHHQRAPQCRPNRVADSHCPPARLE